MAEVVTIGEAMMRSVESPYGILQTVGGSELNLCAALSQLNRSSKWISALGDDQSGQRIINESKRLGIDTSAVSFSPIYPIRFCSDNQVNVGNLCITGLKDRRLIGVARCSCRAFI